MKQDLTGYSEDELSLNVMNDEGLYLIRNNIMRNPTLLNEFFIYTDEQLDVLMTDLINDYNEQIGA